MNRSKLRKRFLTLNNATIYHNLSEHKKKHRTLCYSILIRSLSIGIAYNIDLHSEIRDPSRPELSRRIDCAISKCWHCALGHPLCVCYPKTTLIYQTATDVLCIVCVFDSMFVFVHAKIGPLLRITQIYLWVYNNKLFDTLAVKMLRFFCIGL